jgi:hypothetical protein
LGKIVRRLQLEWVDEVDSGDLEIEDGEREDVEIENEAGTWRREPSELEEFYQTAVTFGLDLDVVKTVKTGSESAAALILLYTLPNLTVLGLEPPCHKGPFDEFGTHIRDRFLPNLKTIQYSHWDTEGGYDLGVLAPFFNLSSLLTVSAYMAHGGGYNLELEDHYGKSSVETLNLHQSDIDRFTFSQLIQLPRSIKNIYYERSDNGEYTDLPVTRREFVAAISLVSHSLESLHLDWNAYDTTEDSTVLGSLARFTNLKKLSVGFGDLLGRVPPSTSGVQLVNVLPPNLEELKLTPDGLGWKLWQTKDFIESTQQLLTAKRANPTILSTLTKVYIPDAEMRVRRDGADVGEGAWKERRERVLKAADELVKFATQMGMELQQYEQYLGERMVPDYCNFMRI